jgi:hypothetical protein
MSSEGDNKSGGESFDVVLVHGATGDGEGAKVLRLRPGHLEAGEVRPLRDGQPLAAGGEVVRLVERPDVKCAYDVKVDYQAPSATAPAAPAPASRKPAQVATRAYRDSWDRTFQASKTTAKNRPN